jgi:hypothetical protein
MQETIVGKQAGAGRMLNTQVTHQATAGNPFFHKIFLGCLLGEFCHFAQTEQSRAFQTLRGNRVHGFLVHAILGSRLGAQRKRMHAGTTGPCTTLWDPRSSAPCSCGKRPGLCLRPCAAASCPFPCQPPSRDLPTCPVVSNRRRKMILGDHACNSEVSRKKPS